jgi:hypothetical protein
VQYARRVGMREDRIARNEALYRELNERIRQVEEHLSARGVADQPELGEYFCECGFDACMEKIHLTAEEYETVRSRPTRFAILPAHLIPDAERVLEQNSRYAMIEKLGEERELVVELDPRT